MFFSQRHPLQPLFFLFDLLPSRQSQSRRAQTHKPPSSKISKNLPGFSSSLGAAIAFEKKKKHLKKKKHPISKGKFWVEIQLVLFLERSTEDSIVLRSVGVSECFVTVGGYHLESMNCEIDPTGHLHLGVDVRRCPIVQAPNKIIQDFQHLPKGAGSKP